VDGDLGLEAEARISSHVTDCDACAAELEARRKLAARVAELPASIEPQRDLWLGIAARIEERKVARATFGRSTRRLLLAAAVVVAAVGSVLIAYTIGRQQAEPVVVRVDPTPGVVTVGYGAASFGNAEIEYREARAELLAALDQRREELSPETLAVVEDNLRVIDSAILRISEAIAEDPHNPHLTTQLASAYRRQIDLLQRANRLPAET
jgi:anti-sigma factor RsiW